MSFHFVQADLRQMEIILALIAGFCSECAMSYLSQTLKSMFEANPSVTPVGIARTRKVSLSVLSRVINGRQRFVSPKVLRGIYLSFPEASRPALVKAYLQDCLHGSEIPLPRL